MSMQVIFGTSALNNNIPPVSEPLVTYPGRGMRGEAFFSINHDILSRHIMLIGGSGCGKTNAFLYTIASVRERMKEEDAAIIFDTKGEFYDMFFRSGDYVLGNSARFRPLSHTWNIFDEILADGWSDDAVSMNAREISAALFHDRGSSSQPFFCNAARDIFRAILIHFVRQAKISPDTGKARLNNEALLKAFQSFTVEHYLAIFKHYPDMTSLSSYLGDGRSNQALGVFGELNSMLSEYFIGILAANDAQKSISMREAVRSKGGKAIFVEYDLSVGEVLTPVYRLLLDQALKEALSRSQTAGSVYVFADEFKLLPKLQHIDDALNFGRGLGVKVMAGIQSIDQLYDIYGKERGAVIASGFGSVFAFHTNDKSSREYITERFGTNYIAFDYTNEQKNSVVCNERDGHTIEEWDQTNLGVGQAFVGLGYESPFLFQFNEYGK